MRMPERDTHSVHIPFQDDITVNWIFICTTFARTHCHSQWYTIFRVCVSVYNFWTIFEWCSGRFIHICLNFFVVIIITTALCGGMGASQTAACTNSSTPQASSERKMKAKEWKMSGIFLFSFSVGSIACTSYLVYLCHILQINFRLSLTRRSILHQFLPLRVAVLNFFLSLIEFSNGMAMESQWKSNDLQKHVAQRANCKIVCNTSYYTCTKTWNDDE